nr:MAG TPA: hypothetical protein [Caudoviricetes sp.]
MIKYFYRHTSKKLKYFIFLIILGGESKWHIIN